MATQWLKCTIFPGLFSTEYGVEGRRFDGRSFGLFALKEDVQVDPEPVDRGVEGWLRVEKVEERNGLCLLLLPESTIESGRDVTVHCTEVSTTPGR